MWVGVLAALGAGLLWGSVFVAPLLLTNYSALFLTFGRYCAFGVVALPIAWVMRQALRQLKPQDWHTALHLSLVGNFVYYLALSAAIHECGAALPTLLIGTLPIVIAITAHWRSGDIPWKKLSTPLLLVAAGLLLVNMSSVNALLQTSSTSISAPLHSLSSYALGAASACIAVAAWTWYPLKNGQWLKHNPSVSATTWATAQGLVSLPIALLGWLLSALLYHYAAGMTSGVSSPLPIQSLFLGDSPTLFIGMMLLMGFGASWLGTLLWNISSQRTSPALNGQLIVFETLSALLYAFIIYQRWPNNFEATGIVCLILGVLLGLKQFR